MKLRLRWKIIIGSALVLSTLYYFSLPRKLFKEPYSTVLEDRQGRLLSATIARDGQWRFPALESVPEKFIKALQVYEDKRFPYHPGVDVVALARAIRQNIRSGKVVSGGSTITMQVIRLSRQGKPRSYFEKFIEIILATRLEWRYSKDEIMALYASHAPFGGNVVGLEAACWRYFGREVQQLSWAEAAMLAVLPNAPSLIHPGKNRPILKIKRDRLLDRMKEQGILDEFTCSLAKAEPIPEEPSAMPRHARHLIQRMSKDGFSQQRLKSTLELQVQQRVEQIIQDHHDVLSGNQINNAAALILEVKTGNVLAYVGNTWMNQNGKHGEEVDIIASHRSTGSILKPFLFAAMLEDGKMLTKTLLPDVPIIINGFAPKNFSREYDGAVPADKALIRSLNIPAVHMLQEYRYERFHSLLKKFGMTTLTQLPDHYGLSLILGGADGTLWDITGMYASLARVLVNHSNPNDVEVKGSNLIHAPVYQNETLNENSISNESPLSAASLFLTAEVLKEVYRPGEESGWRNFFSSKKIAWKTGTSFGFRDGWAIGITPDYAVGVWTGNADGEGRPGLTGTETAAPILFDIFSTLPGNNWFERPYAEMDQIPVCSKSGLRISPYCNRADTLWITTNGLESGICNYHKPVYVTPDKRYRVHQNCVSPLHMQQVNWFVLPPVQEYYYKFRNSSYESLPPFKPGCDLISNQTIMELVYPKHNTRIFIPRMLDGSPGSSVFELAHRNNNSHVYWHLDGQYLGSTLKVHRMLLNPEAGRHKLTLVDEQGNVLEREFVAVAD
ncbi:MAG: penicillin-binding protein 1C [Cyclobacteriaceae bacterium]|nr:penicillin-binding protein 1C [Cyclobacteriaceae bacterium]